jgi:5'/3'-nucleotidase
VRILITNDDGIGSPGLIVLEQIAAEISNDVWVVAPEADCSDTFGAPTVCKPLKLNQLGSQRYSLAGTPADCVLVGIKHLLRPKLPSLLLAGVNAGANLADDIFHSGTLAAAIQATLLKVSSIGFSLITGSHKPKWHTPKSHGADLLRMLLKRGWPDDVLLNVNFPDCGPAEVKGIAFTKQGRRPPTIWSVRHSKMKCGDELCIERHKSRAPTDTDLWAVQTCRISVTPIKVDLTAGSQELNKPRMNGSAKERVKTGRVQRAHNSS